MTLTQRLAAIAVLLIALATAAVGFAGAAPAAAAEPSAVSYLVIDVPSPVIDDLVGIQRRAPQPANSLDEPPFQLDLSFKFCGTYQCLCSPDIDYTECVPDEESDQTGHDRISLASSARTPAVLDRAAQELKSGKYAAVFFCGTYQKLYLGCVMTQPFER
jgi:hypothetical protein